MAQNNNAQTSHSADFGQGDGVRICDVCKAQLIVLEKGYVSLVFPQVTHTLHVHKECLLSTVRLGETNRPMGGVYGSR